MLPGSSAVISQLPDALPIVSPPEASLEEYPDAAELSRGILTMKRWLQIMMKRSEKSQSSHRPDRFSGEPIRPDNPRFRFNSMARRSTASMRPSRMAAAQRRLVSVLFLGRQTVCGVSDGPCQRTVAKTIHEEPQKQISEDQVC